VGEGPEAPQGLQGLGTGHSPPLQEGEEETVPEEDPLEFVPQEVGPDPGPGVGLEDLVGPEPKPLPAGKLGLEEALGDGHL